MHVLLTSIAIYSVHQRGWLELAHSVFARYNAIWFAAYDRINYVRYLPAYVLQMMTLPESHPDAHTFLINGEFVVQRSTGNSFGRIPHDQTIEVTANRDTTSRGGIVGITLNHGAVLKWVVLNEVNTCVCAETIECSCKPHTKGCWEKTCCRRRGGCATY